jgi:hypothetical protein
MVKWLFCLIWGHKRTQDVFTGEYAELPETGWYTGQYRRVPVMLRELADVCPRCGEILIQRAAPGGRET